LVLAVLAALFFQGLWFALVDWSLRAFAAPTPSVSQFVALFTSGISTEPGAAAIDSLQLYPIRICFYWLGVTLVGWTLGRMLNKRMGRRLNASWYELLRPDDADFVWITAETHMDGTCFLFAGVVNEFSVDKTGNLERVVLGYAAKRPLFPQAGTPETPLGGGWEEIPGEFVVLQVKETKTINIDYYFEEKDDALDAPEAGGAIVGQPPDSGAPSLASAN
jgi:hypothetical protein